MYVHIHTTMNIGFEGVPVEVNYIKSRQRSRRKPFNTT